MPNYSTGLSNNDLSLDKIYKVHLNAIKILYD